jgi:hypothetical protein
MIDKSSDDKAQNYGAAQLERLLSDVSAAFIRALEDEIDASIQRWLEIFGTVLGVHKATLVQLDRTDGQLKATQQWSQPGVIIPTSLSTAAEDFP